MDISGGRIANIGNQHEFNVQLSKTFSDKIYTAITGLFFGVTTELQKPAVVGAFAELENKGTIISVHLSQARQHSRALSFTFSSKFFNNGTHSLNCDYKHSFIKYVDGNKLVSKSLGLGYSHAQGYDVYLSMTDIAKNNYNAFELLTKYNLWSSPDKTTTLEFNTHAAYTIEGQYAGKFSLGYGLVLVHKF